MAFPVKDWKASPLTTTPVSAEALEDLEGRLGTYAETVGAYVELGYAQIVSNVTLAATAGLDPVPGLTTTVTVGNRPILVRFGSGGVYSNNAAGITNLSIQEGATVLASVALSGGSANEVRPCYRDVRLAPTTGSHTYKVTMTAVVAGTSTIAAGATNPTYLQVLQI
jgi:hypothetical protein